MASPKGSILPGQQDLQDASPGGEPGGEQGSPASPGEVAVGAVGLCPWGAGVTESCLHLPFWEWPEGFLVLQSHLASKGAMPWGL